MSDASETPRECRPALYGMSAILCANNCGQHCIIQFPATVNAELAAETRKRAELEAKHLADLELVFKDHALDVKDLATWRERADSAESRLKEALCDLANSRSGMVEANKRWIETLRELERVQTLLKEAREALRELVACKDLEGDADWESQAEYRRHQPLWQSARALLEKEEG